MKFASLKCLYESGELPTIVSDSPAALKIFKSSGFNTASVDDVCSAPCAAPREAILIAAIPGKHPNLALRNALRNTATLFVPLLAFSYNERAIEYLMRRLMSLNFSEACERSRRILEYIQHTNDPIFVSSEACRLEIELGNNVSV